jgi:hypothetical protein
MPDVLKKIIPSNEIKNGSTTITDKVGNIQSLSPDVNAVSNVDNLSGVLDVRFDDITYYTT